MELFPVTCHPLLYYYQARHSTWNWPQLFSLFQGKGTYLTKGKVQSGKSTFMLVVNVLLAALGRTPVMVLRNMSDDVKQLMENMESERREATRHRISFPYTLQPIGGKRRSPHTIYIVLANATQLEKITFDSFCLTIDEVDAVDSSEKAAKVQLLVALKQKASLVMGVSATIMDAMIKDDVDAHHIIQLPLPIDYKGLSSITFRPITGEYTGTVTKSIFRDENEDLRVYVDAFSTREATGGHPVMSLVTVSRCVEPNRSAQEWIRQQYPSIASLVLTGEDIRMVVEGTMYLPRFFQKGKQRVLILIGLDVIPEGYRHMRYKPSVRSCLQWFKAHGVARFPRILILAGDISGRGISFTSLDHEWHLTEQFFLASQCDEPELIQKIRLCGRYRDSLPLTLYTTEAIWEDLGKADARLELVMDTMETSTVSSKETVYQMALDKEMFTKRDMTKQYGTPIKVKKIVVEKKRPSMFVTITRHLQSAKTTNVGVFLASLDPNRTYTKPDLLDLLHRATYQQPENILRSFLHTSSYGGVGGALFCQEGDTYRIVNEVRVCWVGNTSVTTID